MATEGLVFNFVDTNTDTVVDSFAPGDEIPLSLVEDRSLSLAVEVIDPALEAQIESMRLTLGEVTRVENVEPYALFGDLERDYLGGTAFGPGRYRLEVEAFSGDRASGEMVLFTTVPFTIVDDSQPEPDLIVTLIDPVTDTVLATLAPGEEIPYDLIEGKAITFSVAAADPDFADQIGSMRLTLGDQTQVENYAPYALFGNKGQDYKGGLEAAPGDYALEIEMFSEKKAGGEMLFETSFAVSIAEPEDDTPPPPPPPPTFEASFALYDATNDQVLDAALTDGEEIDGSNISIVATPSQAAGSAVFRIDGQVVQTENVAPYALFGDNAGDFKPGDLDPGAHTIEVEFFSGRNGSGTSLGRESVSITVAGDTAPPPDATPPEGSLADWADHIVFHFDGNNNDPDDIAAMPMAALLTVSAGLEDRTTFLYGNNLSEPNNANQMARLDDSGDFARSLGIDARNYQDDIDGTTAYLVDILSSGEKVLLLEGGPMEAVYRALEQTDPVYHENLILVSHSSWNEDRDVITRPGVTEARTWDDIEDDFPDVELIEIRDQNNGNNNTLGFNNSGWNWMDGSSEPIVQDARDAMEGAGGTKKNDPSDAGMLYYALTGDENGTPQKAEAYFESAGLYDLPYGDPPAPPPVGGDTVFQGQNGAVVIEAETATAEGDWRQVTVDGETAMLWDAPQSSYGSVPAGETLSYDFVTDESGTYFLALHSGRMKSAMNPSDRYQNGVGGAERTDTGNDAYVSIVNVETGEVVAPPTKLFTGLGGSDQDLRWGTTFDANHQKYQAEFDLEADTQYRIEITGRSDGYVLDRITLNEGSALKDTSVPQSPLVDGTPPAPPGEAAAASIGTDNDFNGVRLWVSNDISEIDDAASLSSLMLVAMNIAASDDNITGSADKMTLEGAYVDTVRPLAGPWVDDVEEVAAAASARYGIDVYSPRTDIDIGGDAAALTAAMTASLNQAYANGEQMIVIAGGPTEFAANLVSDWLAQASGPDQAMKAVWILQGGFAQISHGDQVVNDNTLDYSRDPSRDYFNIGNGRDGDYIQTVHEDLHAEVYALAEAGVGSAYTAAEFDALAATFVDQSLLISIEDQNANDAVRDPTNEIAPTIQDDLARGYAVQYTKNNGNEIDISDVGMTGILLQGTDPLSPEDMVQFTSDALFV